MVIYSQIKVGEMSAIGTSSDIVDWLITGLFVDVDADSIERFMGSSRVQPSRRPKKRPVKSKKKLWKSEYRISNNECRMSNVEVMNSVYFKKD
jgi:hypothetical protein